MFKRLFASFLLLLLLCTAALSQGIGLIHDGFIKGNRIHTVFGDQGVIGQPAAMGSRGSWIYETNGYIGDASILLGLELPVRDYNHDGLPDTVHSVITCQVYRPTKQTDSDPVTGTYWTFKPVAG